MVASRLPSFNRDPEVAAAKNLTILLGLYGGYRRGARLHPYSAEQCVALTEEDLATLEPTDDKTIHLEHFLSPTEFDLTLLAGRSLYLAPAHPAAHKNSRRSPSTASRWRICAGKLTSPIRPAHGCTSSTYWLSVT